MTNLPDITQRQLQALKDFATAENKQLFGQLEEILDDVKKTGQYIFPWHFMKPLYAFKLDKVTDDFLASTPPLQPDGTEDLQQIETLKSFRTELLQMFDKFTCAPFTIQRITELLSEPKRHYKTTAKFFRGLEKDSYIVLDVQRSKEQLVMTLEDRHFEMLHSEMSLFKNVMVVTTVDHVPAEQRVNKLVTEKKCTFQNVDIKVCRRSHVETIPLNGQNGYAENELKPPTKKSVIEPNQAVSMNTTDTNNVSSVIQHNVLNLANTTATTTTTTPDKTVESDKPVVSIENMLLCTEKVSDSISTSPDQHEGKEVKSNDTPETTPETANEDATNEIQPTVEEAALAESVAQQDTEPPETSETETENTTTTGDKNADAAVPMEQE